ncbi:31699_t:CDS:2, partial [Racocetra persica]
YFSTASQSEGAKGISSISSGKLSKLTTDKLPSFIRLFHRVQPSSLIFSTSLFHSPLETKRTNICGELLLEDKILSNLR